MCRNSHLIVQRKNVKKLTFQQLVFRLFWILKKNLCFYLKISSRFIKTTSYVSRGPLTEQHLRKDVLKLWGFSDNFKFLGTMAENLFWIGKTAIDVRREHIIEKCFQKRKIHYVFPFLSTIYFEQKKSLDLRNPQSTDPWKFLGFFLKFQKSFALIWNFFQKTLSWKFFFQVVTTAMRASRGIFWGKRIF